MAATAPMVSVKRSGMTSVPSNHSIVRIAPPPAHFTGAHASRLTMRTKLWRLFQAIRVLVVREGPKVRIHLPPALSPLRTSFSGGEAWSHHALDEAVFNGVADVHKHDRD